MSFGSVGPAGLSILTPIFEPEPILPLTLILVCFASLRFAAAFAALVLPSIFTVLLTVKPYTSLAPAVSHYHYLFYH